MGVTLCYSSRHGGELETLDNHRHPVADLVPSERIRPADVQAAIDAMRSFPRVKGVSVDSTGEWIALGRR